MGSPFCDSLTDWYQYTHSYEILMVTSLPCFLYRLISANSSWHLPRLEKNFEKKKSKSWLSNYISLESTHSDEIDRRGPWWWQCGERKRRWVGDDSFVSLWGSVPFGPTNKQKEIWGTNRQIDTLPLLPPPLLLGQQFGKPSRAYQEGWNSTVDSVTTDWQAEQQCAKQFGTWVP